MYELKIYKTLTYNSNNRNEPRMLIGWELLGDFLRTISCLEA